MGLRYYPKGHKKAAEGSCSAYVWSEKAVKLQLKVYVNKKAKLIDKEGPMPWKPEKDRGYSEFCAAPEGNVVLKVILLQIEESSDDDKDESDEDSYEYYESEYTQSDDADDSVASDSKIDKSA